jgi:hypothetical protein
VPVAAGTHPRVAPLFASQACRQQFFTLGFAGAEATTGFHSYDVMNPHDDGVSP